MKIKEKDAFDKNNSNDLIDGKYGIKDLVDIKQLKELFAEFNKSTGFTIGFLDHPGLNVLIATGWRDICTKFHRKSPKSLENCNKSNHHLLDKLKKPGQIVIEACENGMVDCATPIIIEGKHIASLATGQLFLEKPDIARFKKQAKMFGYNEKAYLRALQEIPVVNEKKLKDTTQFLGTIAVILSQAGYAHLTMKREEEQMKDNEIMLRRITENITDVIWMSTPKIDKMLYVNSAFEKIWGIKTITLYKNPNKLLESIHPDDKKRFLEELKSHAKGKYGPIEYRIIRPDKSIRYILDKGSAIRDSKGKLIAMTGTARDQTERILAEKRMRESERLLNETGKTAKVGGWEFNVKTLDLHWSDEVYSLHEVDKNTFKPTVQKAINFYAPSSKPLIQKAVNRAIKFGEPFDLELEVITAKGNHIWVHALGKSVLWYNGYKKVTGTFQDITQRKKIELSLKESNANYEVIFNNAVDAIFIADPKTRKLVDCNRAAEILTGHSKKELLSMTAEKLHPKENVQETMKNFELQARGKKKISFSIVITKNKKLIPVAINASKIKINNKEYMQGIFRDISEQQEAEDKLVQAKLHLEEEVRKRTSFLDSIVENIPDMIFVKDAKDLKFELFNKAGEQLLGQKRKQLYGKNDYDFFPKKQADFFILKDRATLNERKLLDIPEEPINTKTGQRFLHTKKIPILNEKGKPEYLLGISEDITEKKKVQEELILSKKRLDLATEASKIGIWEYDLEKNTSVKNLRHDQIFGYNHILPKDKWRLDIFFEHIHPEDATFVKNAFDKAKETGKVNFDCRIVWPNKSIHWINEMGTVERDEKGKPIKLLGTVADITEKVENSIKLQESYKQLQEADLLKSKFLTITSHELKTPLTPAKIQTQMLLQGDLGPLSEKQKESFDIILRNINRLNRLIEDILEISRLEAEGFKLDFEEVHIKEIIENVIANLDPVAKNKGLNPIVYKADNLPPIIADKQRITEVVTNLVDNAIKFTSKGGITIEATQKGNEILVKVQDTGCGIPSEFFDRVFMPFSQAEPVFSRVHGGTGLGLSICKGIVKQHNGTIWFNSKVGKGTTFYFTLPLVYRKRPLNSV